jgi:hypothetical protein
MESTVSKNDKKIEAASIEGLIQREWEIINELQILLKNPELTVDEKVRVANVFAFHANTLNRLLKKNGEKESIEELSLGDYLKGVEPRIARRIRRDFIGWKRTLSLRRY